MNSVSPGGDPDPNDPNDPLRYAPRALPSKANPQTRPVRPASSRSGFDEMLEEAIRKSRRHPLDPEVVHEPDRTRGRLGAAGRVAAAIGVAAIIGFLFFSVIPKSQGSNPTPPAAADVSDDSQALLQKFVQFEKSQDNVPPTGAVQATPDDSQMLQKFLQWQQKQR